MQLNRPIIFAAIFIGSVGALQAVLDNKKISRVLIGAYAFTLVLAAVDLFGAGAGKLAGAIALLAAFYVGLTQFPWQQLGHAVTGSK